MKNNQIKILLIKENEVDYSAILNGFGKEFVENCRLDTALSCSEGLSLLTAGKYDVVFIDSQTAETARGGFIEQAKAKNIAPPVIVIAEANGFDKIAETISTIRSLKSENFSDSNETEQTEKAINFSDSLLRLATEAGGVGIWEWDIATSRQIWNDQLKSIFGFSTDVTGLTTDDLIAAIHPEDLIETESAFRGALEHHKNYQHTYRIVTTAGEVRWLEARGQGEYGADGRPLKMRGSAVDITERKRVEEQLREAEERYRRLVEFSPNAIVVYVDEVIVYVNRAGVELHRAGTSEELIGKSVLDFVPPAFRAEASRHHESIHQNQAATSLRTVRLVRLDGTEADIEVTSVPFTFNGKPAIQTIITDITKRKQSEDELRNSEERYRAFIEQSTEAVWRVEIEKPCPLDVSEDEKIDWLYRYGYIAECNQLMARMYGFDNAEQLIGIRVSEMMPRTEPANIEQLRAFIGANYRLTDSVSYELDRNGGTRIFSNNLTGIVQDNFIQRVWGTQRDITESRQAEIDLRKSEERFRLLFVQMMDGFYRTTPAGNFVEINPAMVKMFGYSSKAEMMRIDIQNELYFSPDERKSYIRDSGSEESDTYRMRRKDGSEIWVEENGRYLRDEGGKILYHEGIIRDVTQRKLAEEKLIESEKQYRFVAEAMPQQVWTAQPGGQVDYVNRRNTDYFGFPTKNLENLQWIDLVHPDDLQRNADEWRHSMQTGDPYEVEVRLKRRDGAYRWHLARAFAMRGQEGEIIKWFGTNTDIEDLKTAEENLLESETKLQQAQKLESVGRLAGGIAHDFNNMLTAINGYSDLTLRRLEYDNPLRANIIEIKKAGERSAQLTQQLLAFSRQQVLKPKIVNLNEVIAETSNMLQRLIGENIQLITVLNPKIGQVKADPGQISQVIMNLVVNARDAMPHGGNLTIKTLNVEIDYDFEKHSIPVKSESYVMLEVRDTGIGMTPEIQRQIFEPFFTTKETGKGTGLGLATVYGIVRQSGGYIQVSSKIDQGSVIEIYLPRITESVTAVHISDSTDNPQTST